MAYLALLSDALLLAGTAALAGWCWILARRLRAMGEAPSSGPRDVVPDAVARLESRLAELDAAINASATRLSDRTAAVEAANDRADDRIGRMEMLLASLEDLEEEQADRMLHVPERRDRDEPAANDERLPSFRATRHAFSGGRS